jgi:hypothetical protein
MYYTDANGIEHESYEAACHYYGADTAEQIEIEERLQAEEEREDWLDHCAAHDLWVEPAPYEPWASDEIVF